MSSPATDANGNLLTIDALDLNGGQTLPDVDIFVDNSNLRSIQGICYSTYFTTDGPHSGPPDLILKTGWCSDASTFNETGNFINSNTSAAEYLNSQLSLNLNGEWQLVDYNRNDPSFPVQQACACTIPDFDKPIYAIEAKRIAFDGGTSKVYPDHITSCCFKDANNASTLDSNKVINYTESSDVPGNLYNTCSFEHRSVASSGNAGCSGPVNDYCFNPNDTLQQFADKWTNGAEYNCYYAFQRKVSANEAGLTYSSGGEYAPAPQVVSPQAIYDPVYAENAVNAFYATITSKGVNISANPTDPNYNVITDTLYQMCTDYPFACKGLLESVCQNQTSQTLVENPGLLRWCGCHLPDDAYGKYVDVYKVAQECAPSCNRQGVIPNAQNYIPGVPSNTTPTTCKENICVIDNLNIQYTGAGDININQVCGGCAGTNNQCECIIENDRFILTNEMKANLQVSQVCGKGTFYYESSVDPLTGQIVYNQTNNPLRNEEQKVNTLNWFLIMLGIILFFVLLGVAGAYFGL
jgi:hypothetical protein